MARLLRLTTLLQALCLALTGRAERGNAGGGFSGTGLVRHALVSELRRNDSSEPAAESAAEPAEEPSPAPAPSSPPSRGRLTAIFDELEAGKQGLEQEQTERLKSLEGARLEKRHFQDSLWNVSSVLDQLSAAKVKGERAMARLREAMVNISSQYEAQVHAANVALSCLAGSCGPADLKLWDAWACKGLPAPEDLTTHPAPPSTSALPTTSYNPANAGPKPELVVDEQTGVSDTPTTTPGPTTFASDLGDDTLGDGLDNGRLPTPTTTAPKAHNPEVKVFVGDKKVAEVNTSQVQPGVKVGITVRGQQGKANGVNVTVKGPKSAGGQKQTTVAAESEEADPLAAGPEAAASGEAAPVDDEAPPVEDEAQPMDDAPVEDAAEAAAPTQAAPTEAAPTQAAPTQAAPTKAAPAQAAAPAKKAPKAAEPAHKQPAPAKQPAAAAPAAAKGLEGKWTHEVEGKESLESIKGSTVHWSNNKTTELGHPEGGGVSLHVDGKDFTGKLEGDEIVWSDGDVWKRVA